MKKIYSILFLAVMCFGSTMQAQTLTIADGTSTSTGYQVVPIDGNNVDRYQHVQIIYPKGDLAAMTGKAITKMTFYLRSTASAAWGTTVKISLAEVSANNFSESSKYNTSELTEVFIGVWNGNTETIVVEFADAFEYTGENNLLFDLQTQAVGSYKKASFYGKGGYDYQQSLYGYNASAVPTESGTGRAYFLPKTTFTYEEAGSATCAKPTLTAGEVTAKTAAFSWTAGGEETEWQYICLPASEKVDWSAETVVKTSATEVTLNNLSANTAYKFYLRAYCSDEDQSADATVSFTTEKSCFEPTLLAVVEAETTSNSAKITWSASGKGETQYQYTYEVWSDETPDWTAAVVTDQTEATLTDLNPATPYQVWVRSYCSADDQSEAVTTYFSTKCGVMPLPFAEDFSEENDCWTKVDCYEGYASTGVYNGAFRFYYTTTPPQYLVSPELAVSANGVKVAFDYRAESSTYPETFKVGYSTTTKEIASFTWSDEVTSTNTTAEQYSEILPAGVKYIAIQHTSDNQYYFYIDNFAVTEEEPQVCALPTGLTVSEVTAASASVAWESEAETFALQLSTDGLEFADINGVITNPYVLNGLEEQTQYWVRVKAICDESLESEWTEAVAFTTPCAAKAFGYTENFDGESLTACWENKDVHGMNEWSAYENAARYATTSNIANHATLVSPWITIEAESNPVLFFDWQNTGATAKLSIEAEGEAVAELQDLSEPTGESFVSFRLYLTEYKGKTVRFLFYGESSAKSKYLYLDNFQVVEKPLLPPTDLKAEAVEGGASVTWKAAWDEVSWAIQVKATAAEDWVPVNAVILEPAYTLTGLDDETEYEVQVQAIYGENQFSAWTESAVFTTPAKTPTAVENAAVKNTATKRIVNGQLLIELGGDTYNAQGVSVK